MITSQDLLQTSFLGLKWNINNIKFYIHLAYSDLSIKISAKISALFTFFLWHTINLS